MLVLCRVRLVPSPVCWGRACPESLEGLGWGWTRIALAPYPEVTESRHLTPPLPSANTCTIMDAWISQRSPAATEVSPRASVATSRWPLLAGFVRSLETSRLHLSYELAGPCGHSHHRRVREHSNPPSRYCTGKALTCLETASTQLRRRVGNALSTGCPSYEVRQNETVAHFSR